PTYEKIDPVRFIGNYSSGKMGYAIADAAADLGADVTVVSGPVNVSPQNNNVKVVHVESAIQMLEECDKLWSEANIGIMCAAVADYTPAHKTDSKIKREHTDSMTLELVKNPDIAATLGNKKQAGQYLVGFALETESGITNATDKLTRKNLDMICLNSLADKGAGFGTDTNKVTIIDKSENIVELPLMNKTDVAKQIVNKIINNMS
ncbi:MAG: phosphopantothenoylcysteine decarboxylase, partial [Paramuribaculum sp.]|nr:phosphopantothenoylcysteine decarboxylase [Paramuribaculum sp.]